MNEPRTFLCPNCGSLQVFFTIDLNECLACGETFDFADVVFDDGEE